MHKLALLLTVFAASATAADFRALNVGESCATAREWEIAQGSTALKTSTGGGADIYGFQGQAFGRGVYLSYFCRNGLLFTGNYSFPIESLDQAVESYREIHDQMLSIYGEAFLDQSPWNGNIDAQATSLESPKYLTSWTAPRTHTSLTLMRSQPSEITGWRVFIVIGPSLSKSPSDKP
jgi:hypothetical protein